MPLDAPRPDGDSAGTVSSDRPSGGQILTVSLEDWFHAGALRGVIAAERWDRFQPRIEDSLAATLDLLAQHRASATFFALGWMAERHPALLRRVADAGHEVASKGYAHRGIQAFDRDSFRADLRRGKGAIEQAIGREVLGHRVSDWITPEDAWVLEVLAEEGFRYDSSMRPMGRHRATWSHLTQHDTAAGPIWEVPVSSVRLGPFRLAYAGGNMLRQLPEAALHWALRQHDARDPLVSWFQTWELDPAQPVVSSAGWMARTRHYRNLDQMRPRLEALLAARPATSVAAHLGLEPALLLRATARRPSTMAPTPLGMPVIGGGVSVVIPCYNEADTIPYVARTLDQVAASCTGLGRLSLVLVDDGSTDGTGDALEAAFGARPDCTIVRHPVNRGIAAAIATGIAAARDEIVCSIDADCSYDPQVLPAMVAALGSDVTMVTASPYHPEGGVQGVPQWRLGLSRGLTWLYRRVLRTPLHTCTSCCRVYRRSRVMDVPLTHGDFRGILELVVRLDARGDRIVEVPAVLETRLFGQSKMRVARTVMGHLKMLSGVLRQRYAADPRAAVPPVTDAVAAARLAGEQR